MAEMAEWQNGRMAEGQRGNRVGWSAGSKVAKGRGEALLYRVTVEVSAAITRRPVL